MKCLGIPSDARSQLQRVPPGSLGRPLQREHQGVSCGVICNDSAYPGIQPNDHIPRWHPPPPTYLSRFLRMLIPSFYQHQVCGGGFGTGSQDLL